jgi:large subunit ribosomal protein L18
MNANERRTRRKKRIRTEVSGTPERPRLVIVKSLKSLYAQAIDDTAGRTLCSARIVAKKNIQAGVELGQAVGAKLTESKIKSIVFDRNGYRYHGVVKSFADAVRTTGVAF